MTFAGADNKKARLRACAKSTVATCAQRLTRPFARVLRVRSPLAGTCWRTRPLRGCTSKRVRLERRLFAAARINLIAVLTRLPRAGKAENRICKVVCSPHMPEAEGACAERSVCGAFAAQNRDTCAYASLTHSHATCRHVLHRGRRHHGGEGLSGLLRLALRCRRVAAATAPGRERICAARTRANAHTRCILSNQANAHSSHSQRF
jgi:hypothetical protein